MRRALVLGLLGFIVAVCSLGGSAGPAAAFCTTSLCHVAEEPWIAAEFAPGMVATGATATGSGGMVTAAGALTVGQAAQAGAITGGLALGGLGITAWNLSNVPEDQLPEGTPGPVTSGTWTYTKGSGGGAVTGTITVTALPTKGTSGTTSFYLDNGGKTTNQAMYLGVEVFCVDTPTVRTHFGGGYTHQAPAMPRTQSWATACSSGGGVDHVKGFITVDGGGGTGVRVAEGTVVAGGVPGADPDRWVEQTVTCLKADGTEHDVQSLVSVVTGDIIGQSGSSIAGLDCPAGEVALDWTGDLVTEGGDDLRIGELHSPSSTRAVPRECLTRSQTCKAVLEQRQADDTWLSCFQAGVNCRGWWSSPVRNTTYRCQLGNATVGFTTVGLGVCSIYREDDGPLKPPVPITPQLPNDEGSCQLGWGDVLTGAIVYKAVTCALVWAFVPSAEALTAAQGRIGDAWNGTAPQQMAAAAGSIGAPLRDLATTDDDVDCLGPAITWEWAWIVNAHPFSTCDEPTATIIAWFRPIFGAVVLIGAMYSGTRLVVRTIGADTPREV